MSDLGKVAVVGASLAGVRAVEFLRRAKYEGELVLIGAEPHLPYDRPPLSKELLRGEWEVDRLALRKKSYDELGVELLLGRRAASLDVRARAIALDDGSQVSFDGLVIATGGYARPLPGQPGLSGIHTLRTLDDSLSIRRELESGPRVAVVGAGFIGAEVAASVRQLGLDVTMIEALDAPLEKSLGSKLGLALQELHERQGVKVLCGRRVARFEGRERVTGVVLADGTHVECGLVVVGIGMAPSVSWLEGSGIELEDGVRCDECLRASAAGVVAAGDVASWHNALFDERMRVEHWTTAIEQARHAVTTLLAAPGEARSFETVPMFWSDQFDIKIQGVGRPRPTDELHVFGSPEDGKLVALYGRSGRLVGAVTFNQPPKLIRLRALIAKRGTLEEALEIAEA